jgi:hypothetical protein
VGRSEVSNAVGNVVQRAHKLKCLKKGPFSALWITLTYHPTVVELGSKQYALIRHG